MSIADWFKARESRRYTPVSESAAGVSGDVRDGVWVKCPSCKRISYEGELAKALQTCPGCGHHFDLTAPQRIALLADADSFTELDAGVTSVDPLGFTAAKSYATTLESARAKSGLAEAVITGSATIAGTPVVLGAMDFRFIGASMGSAVGEKVTRAFEVATERRSAVVLSCASGGARMQEGMLSLMQMAKTSAAVRRHSDAGLPYVSILTNPTMGGVTASFAVLADVVVAEPGALVGFAGPRVIEQTIKQHLPKGFQSSEFLLEHGMVDAVVPRAELAERVALLLSYLAPREGGGAA